MDVFSSKCEGKGPAGPVIGRNCVKTLLDLKFIKVMALEYEKGRCYFEATRRSGEDIAAVKSCEEFKEMLPDAVSCIVVLKRPEDEPRLLLSYEYRYPAGRFLLSPPAGLLDEADLCRPDAAAAAAVREIYEETGIEVKPEDRVYTVNPCALSTPGMSDESNALVCAVIENADIGALNRRGIAGSELFGGFVLPDEKEAMEILLNGRDSRGIYYSIYTWAALAWFASGLWRSAAPGEGSL